MNPLKDVFFERMETLGLALVFEEIKLKPGYSEVEPSGVDLVSHFSRNIILLSPIVSAAMDTVTEFQMAIAMAKLGGLGVIHRSLTLNEQTEQVRRVKLHMNPCIPEPICVHERDSIEAILAKKERKKFKFHSFPVLHENGTLAGLITRNDFDMCMNQKLTAAEVMTPLSELITASPDTSIQGAYAILTKARKKILILLNPNNTIAGMYVFSDIKNIISGTRSMMNIDEEGHLRVGGAVGTKEEGLARAESLIQAGCDVIVIDASHGDSRNVYDTLREIKATWPAVDVVAGNVTEASAAKRLVDAGADGIKVGIGPGSICTTRVVTGGGCPQATAVYNCAKALRGSGVPVCADGGIKNSGDIVIAIGLGASSVMLGRLLAGTTESPGEVDERHSGVKVKLYRGMGSQSALKKSAASRNRYSQQQIPENQLVAQGVEAHVPFQGSVEDVVNKLIGGLRAGMGLVGAPTIPDMQEKADFYRHSAAGMAESYPHSIIPIPDSL